MYANQLTALNEQKAAIEQKIAEIHGKAREEVIIDSCQRLRAVGVTPKQLVEYLRYPRISPAVITSVDAIQAIPKKPRKPGSGRPVKVKAEVVVKWRSSRGASLSETAKHFKLSVATVSRHCRTLRAA